MLRRFRRESKRDKNQNGAVMYEYVIVAAVMVTGLLTGIYLIRQNLSETFSSAGSAVGWSAPFEQQRRWV